MTRTNTLSKAFPLLTEREVSCALAISDGMSNCEISVKLGIAEKTVKNVNHWVNIKMGVAPGGSSRVRVARKVWILTNPAE